MQNATYSVGLSCRMLFTVYDCHAECYLQCRIVMQNAIYSVGLSCRMQTVCDNDDDKHGVDSMVAYICSPGQYH